FTDVGRLSGKPKDRRLTEQERSNLQTYLLTNCEDVLQYERIFMAEKRFEYRYATEDELEEMKQREFTGWMFTYVCYIKYPRVRNRDDPWVTVTRLNPRGRVQGSSELEDPLQPSTSGNCSAAENLAGVGLVVDLTDFGEEAVVHVEDEPVIGEFHQDPDSDSSNVHAALYNKGSSVYKLSKNWKLNGDGLNGLSYSELASLESMLNQGLLIVEEQTDKAYDDFATMQAYQARLSSRRTAVRNKSRELRLSPQDSQQEHSHDHEELMSTIDPQDSQQEHSHDHEELMLTIESLKIEKKRLLLLSQRMIGKELDGMSYAELYVLGFDITRALMNVMQEMDKIKHAARVSKAFINNHKETFRFILKSKSKIYSLSIDPKIMVRELTLDVPGLESQTLNS
uniref:Uncharacterized protein n=1 Tax=Brassica oleracea var. oleracea TaxID=109376 RepID=A0A0D3C4C7_BRAOL